MRGVDRLNELKRWIETQLNAPPLALEAASADASFRRYFRVTTAGASLIAMDAPPAHEDCRPFVRIARLMEEAGLNVPRVIVPPDSVTSSSSHPLLDAANLQPLCPQQNLSVQPDTL